MTRFPPIRVPGVLGCLVLLLSLLPGGIASADDGFPAREGVRFGASGLTDFPLQAGGGIHVELPGRIRVHTSLGAMPPPYLDAIHAAAEEFGWYDQSTADLISAALEDSLIWRIGVGWRPWAAHGFYFRGGYTLAALGGGLGGIELVEIITGTDLPPDLGGDRQFDLTATVHMIDFEVGWELLFLDGLLLRFALGGAFTLKAIADVSPSWDVAAVFAADWAEAEAQAEEYLEDTIERYIHAPTVSVALGWRF